MVPGARDSKGRPMQYVMSPEWGALIDEYLSEFSPFPDGPWLFPNRRGEPKSSTRLVDQLKREVKMLTGLTLSPVDFRHISAKLYLERHPGEYEVVRRFLGHAKLEYTIQQYREFETAISPTALDEIVRAT